MYGAPLGLYSYACAKDCFVVSVGAFSQVHEINARMDTHRERVRYGTLRSP